jgi:hypothetical protein
MYGGQSGQNPAQVEQDAEDRYLLTPRVTTTRHRALCDQNVQNLYEVLRNQ